MQKAVGWGRDNGEQRCSFWYVAFCFSPRRTGLLSSDTPDMHTCAINAKFALAAAVRGRKTSSETKMWAPHVIYSVVSPVANHRQHRCSPPLSLINAIVRELPETEPPPHNSSSHQCCIGSIPITSAARLDTRWWIVAPAGPHLGDVSPVFPREVRKWLYAGAGTNTNSQSGGGGSRVGRWERARHNFAGARIYCNLLAWARSLEDWSSFTLTSF